MTFLFIVSHGQEGSDDSDPVCIVRDDGAIGCGVLPSDEGVVNAPTTTTIDLGIATLIMFSIVPQAKNIAYINMPDALVDVVRPWS